MREIRYITDRNLEAFEKAVQGLLNDGWQCQGGVSYFESDRAGSRWSQGLTRFNSEADATKASAPPALVPPVNGELLERIAEKMVLEPPIVGQWSIREQSKAPAPAQPNHPPRKPGRK